MKKITKVVITGGQLAGKDTIILRLKRDLENHGYYVIRNNEIAEYIMRHNLKPFGENKIPAIEFQNAVFKQQIFLEDLYLNLAKKVKTTRPIVFLINRGLLDGKAHLKEGEFEKICELNNYNIKDVKKRYDIILCLETMAKLGEYNQYDNNNVRFQNLEEAVEMNDKFLTDYKQYFKNVQYFKAESNFERKYNKILKKLLEMLNK